MSKHTKTPWTNDLTPMIKGGDKSIKINGFPLSVDYRILAEDNFQFAKHRVNLHDELVEVLEAVIDFGILTAEEDESIIHYQITSVLKKARGEVWIF